MADPIDLSAVQAAATQLAQSLGRVTGSASAAGSAISSFSSQYTGNIKNVGRGMAQLRSEMDKGRVGFSQAGQSLRYLQSSFDDLDAATKNSAAGQRIAAEQQKMSSQLLRQGVGEVAADLTKAGIGAALDYFKNQLFTAVKGIQDNVGGMQLAFNLQNRALTDQITVLEQLSQGASQAATALAMIPGPWGKAAAVASATVGALAGLDAKVKKVALEGIQVLQVELAKTDAAFKVLVGSGALLSNGMSDVRKYSAMAGLDLKDFSSIVANNAAPLTQFGGTMADGVKKFSAVSGAMAPFRTGLLALGISTQDQSQATIDYMAMLQQSGQLEGKNADQIAKGTAQYLGNMKAISALTGEDIKTQQARVKAASEQAGVQAALAEGGKEMQEKFAALTAQFPGYEKEIGQLLTVGEITDPLRATMLANNAELDNALRTGVSNIKDTNKSATDASREIEAIKMRDGAAMAANARENQKTYGTIAMATGQMAEHAALANRDFATGQKGAEQLAKGGKSSFDAMQELITTTDTLTSESNKAASAFVIASQKLNTEVSPLLSKFVKEGVPLTGSKGVVQTVQEGAGMALAGAKFAGKSKEDLARTTIKGGEDALLSVLTSLKDAINRLVGVMPRRPGEAEGGIVNGPASGYLSLTHGREAVIPLPSGESVPVNIQGAEKMFAGEMAAQREKQQVGSPPPTAGVDVASSVASAMESALTGPAGFGKAIGELKNQIAESGQQQTGILQQQIEKLDALVTAMQDSADSNRRIANEMA